MIYDNQALKLHRALTELRSTRSPNNAIMLNVFSEFFKLDPNEPAIILENIVKLHKQISEIKSFCDGTIFLEKQFNKWSQPINKAFLSVNLLSHYSNFKSCYTDEDLFLLETTHDAIIDKYQHFKNIDQQTLDELILNLSNLLEEVVLSEASSKVKDYIKIQINTLIKNLNEYHLYGIRDIHQTIDSTLGHIITDEDYKVYVQETQQGTSLLNELIKIGVVLQILESGSQVALNFQQFIQQLAC